MTGKDLSSSRFGRNTALAVAAAALLAVGAAGVQANTVVVLKRHKGIATSTGAGTGNANKVEPLDSDFVNAITGGTIKQYNDADTGVDMVNDAFTYAAGANGNGSYENYGAAPYRAHPGSALFEFNLGAVPNLSKADIVAAQLRVFVGSTGGTAPTLAAITTHQWTEGTGNGDEPGKTTSASGVTDAEPNGTNTTPDGVKGWGPGDDSLLGPDDHGSTITGDHSYTVNNNKKWGYYSYWTFDVTKIVNAWVNNIKPNYGLMTVGGGNTFDYQSSESTGYSIGGAVLSQSDVEPALFIEYKTSAVPAPASAWLALAGLGLLLTVPMRSRRRQSL